MWWTVELDAQFVGSQPEINIVDASDAYLVALSSFDDVAGAVTSVNLKTRIIVARFDIEAADTRDAFIRASDIATKALHSIDVRPNFDRAEIFRDVVRGTALESVSA